MENKQVRIDLSNSNKHTVDSYISNIKYDNNGNIEKKSVVQAPLSNIIDIQNENLEERLFDIVFRSLNFTSKFCGICELTGKKYNDENLRMHTLKYVKAYNSYFLAGNIMFHPDNEYMLKWTDLIFWSEYNIIPKNNLEGIKLNVSRSSGEIDTECFIEKEEGFIWSKKHNEFILRVKLDGGKNEKYVLLSKIHRYNPNLTLKVTLPHIDYYKDSPEWIYEIYNSWIEFVKNVNFGEGQVEINYSVDYL
jgi:hypothetical protein